MDLSVSTCYDYRIPLQESLLQIRNAGFKLVSLGGRQEHSQYHKEPGRERLRSIIAQLGITIDSIHAPFGSTTDISEPEDVLRRSAVVDVIRSIEACADLGVRTLILHLNATRTDDISQRLKSVRASITALLNVARKRGVRLAAENLPGGNSLTILNYALELFDDEHFGLCFDSGHDAIDPGGIDLIGKFGERLYAIHLHDNDGNKDLHQLAFEGKYNFPNLAAQLNKGSVSCPITIEAEVHHSTCGTPEAFLASAMEGGKRFIEMLKG
jgi:sugar phosphate isomerase/epimerase